MAFRTPLRLAPMGITGMRLMLARHMGTMGQLGLLAACLSALGRGSAAAGAMVAAMVAMAIAVATDTVAAMRADIAAAMRADIAAVRLPVASTAVAGSMVVLVAASTAVAVDRMAAAVGGKLHA